MENDNQIQIMVQPYMMCELCLIYSVSDKTLRNWISRIEPELGERYGRYYSTRQVEIIFRNFGVPYRIDKSMATALF